jgi:amidase
MDAFRSAVEWADAIRLREVSPSEVTELYLARIDRLDPQLNAFCLRADDDARAAARRATDAVMSTPAEELPPFHGVPIPIKDLYNVAGWPTSHGSQASSPEPVGTDDLSVARLRAAGFVLLGKTNTPELGSISYTENERFGATRNPWDVSRTPGGSSGGAGAAVAAGLAPIGHASDGGGSIRIPASCTGLVGLKASRNRIPAEVNGGEGFSTNGVLTRTVADTAAVLDILGRPDPLGWYNVTPPEFPFAELARRDVGRLRIGITSTPAIPMPIDPEVLAAHAAAAELLVQLGHEVVPVELSLPDVDTFIGAFTAVWNTSSAGLPLDPDRLEPLNRALRDQALELDSIAYVESVYATQLLGRPLIEPFGSQFDVLLTPTLSCLPPEVGAVWNGTDIDPVMALLNCFPMAVFTSVWNVTGLPAISLPLGQSETGLPIGMQFVGGPGREALLLQLATQLEAAAPWADRRPVVS